MSEYYGNVLIFIGRCGYIDGMQVWQCKSKTACKHNNAEKSNAEHV